MEREEIIERLSRFLDEFYRKELAKAVLEKMESISVNFFDLDKFDIEVADLLLEKPEEIIPLFEEAAKEVEPELEKIRIRIFNLPEERQIRIRNLRAEHIGKGVILVSALHDLDFQQFFRVWKAPFNRRKILVLEEAEG